MEFRYGETIYGPYTVKEDPSAIPKRGEDMETPAETKNMRGIELYRGDELLFRGGARYFANGYRLYNEEGEMEVLGPITAGGKSLEGNGNTAGPSEWEIAGRYLTWTIFLIWAVTAFIAGLQ